VELLLVIYTFFLFLNIHKILVVHVYYKHQVFCTYSFEWEKKGLFDLFFRRYRFFPNERTGVSGFGTAPIPRRQPGAENDDANLGRRVFGGRGHVLGDH
jgi:hypothetical protein